MQKQRSKQQIAEGMKRVQEAKRLRSFVKDKLYPALLDASESIDDAKYLLGSFSNMMMEKFLAKMKEIKFNELKLEEKLDPKAKKYEQFKVMLDLFKDESIFTSRELIEGMKNEIEMMITNEMKERELHTLKTNFLE